MMCGTSVSSGHTSASTATITMLRANPVACRRGSVEIKDRRGDVKTYLAPILFAGSGDRETFLAAYYKKNKNARKTALYRKKQIQKHPDTVGKFYKELVEHSGKVSAEEFWQRYDYRCGDLTRVLRELQAAKQHEKMVQKKKRQSHSDEGSSSAVRSKSERYLQKHRQQTQKTKSFSWMNVKSVPNLTVSPKSTEKNNHNVMVAGTTKREASPMNSSPRDGSVPIEQTGTVDTADNHDEMTDEEDHVETFKQTLAPMIENVLTKDNAKVLDDSSTEGDAAEDSKVSSIFRDSSGTTTEQVTTTITVATKELKASDDTKDKDVVETNNKAGSLLVIVWITALVLTAIVVSPTARFHQFDNALCAPIRPGKIVEAASVVDTDTTVSTYSFSAPWWAPDSMKESIFEYFCATDVEGNHRRPRTQLTTDVYSKKQRGRDQVKFMSVSIKDMSSDGKNFLTVRKAKSIQVDTSGTNILVEKMNRGKNEKHLEFDAPWALV